MIDGFTKYDLVSSGLISFVSMLMVFAVLILIIYLTELSTKFIKSSKPQENLNSNLFEKQEICNNSSFNLDDEDAVVASIIASIEFRNVVKKNVRVVSIKEIK